MRHAGGRCFNWTSGLEIDQIAITTFEMAWTKTPIKMPQWSIANVDKMPKDNAKGPAK
jgi:hypothetical protein